METGAGKLKQLLGARVVVSLNEARSFRGQMIGYDKHLNVVLKECEECRIIDGQMRTEPRGLVVLRGVNVETIGADRAPASRSSAGPNRWQPGVGAAQAFA